LSDVSQRETSAKLVIRCSGVSEERRKSLEIEGFGFLPKAATLLLQRSQSEIWRQPWDLPHGEWQ
jgi:hypothetical protein